MNRSASALRTLRWFGIVSSLLAHSLPAHAALQGPTCDDPQSDEFVLQNRSTLLWIGGSPLPQGSELTGVFLLNAPEKRASYRFRSPVDKVLSSVWLYFSDVTLPAGALLRLSVKGDLDGLPIPAGSVATTSTFAPHVGWQEVTIPGSLQLQRCLTYHLLIEPGTASDFTTLQFVELTSAVSRYPVEYQAEDPSSSEDGSFYDLELSLMFETPPLPLVSQWNANHFQFNPIFAVQCTDGTRFGQPYDTHDELRVFGDLLLGQRIRIETATEVNHVSVFVSKARNATDQLEAELYDTAGASQFKAGVVRDPTSVTGRAHWFGGKFEPVTLQPGDYCLMLRSVMPGSNPKGYFIPALRSSLPAGTSGDDGSFGGDASYMVSSPDNGFTFLALAAKPDMGFLLANLHSSEGNTLAIFDEGGVYHPGGMEALVAQPGALLNYNVEPRNIGTTLGPILYEIVVENTGTVIGSGQVNVGANQDFGGGFSFNNQIIPASYTSGSLFRVRIRLGHTDFSTTTPTNTWDDEVRFEVRIQ